MGRGSHGLGARRATSSRPKGPKAVPKGRQLEVGPRRGPRLLVYTYIFKKDLININIFTNYLINIDIVIFKNDLINIDIAILKTCQYIYIDYLYWFITMSYTPCFGRLKKLLSYNPSFCTPRRDEGAQ